MVEAYQLQGGNQVRVGSFEIRDGQIVTDPPDSLFLKGMLTPMPGMYVGRELGTFVDPVEEPAVYLEAMPLRYHGTYLWCERASEPLTE